MCTFLMVTNFVGNNWYLHGNNWWSWDSNSTGIWEQRNRIIGINLEIIAKGLTIVNKYRYYTLCLLMQCRRHVQCYAVDVVYCCCRYFQLNEELDGCDQKWRAVISVNEQFITCTAWPLSNCFHQLDNRPHIGYYCSMALSATMVECKRFIYLFMILL